MGLSSILQQIEKRGKLPNKQPPVPQNNEVKESKEPVLRTGTTEKYVDPVVARLKEKRRLEREQAEAAKSKKSGANSTKVTTKQPRAAPVSRQSITKTTTKPNWDLPPPPAPPKKKLSYNELMQRAKKVDHEKLSIKISHKSSSPEATAPKAFPTKATAVSKKPSSTTPPSSVPPRNNTMKSKPIERAKPDVPIRKPLPKVPMPARQPNAKIQERLKQKQGRKLQGRGYGYDEDEDDDDDLSDFLVSDEEEEQEVGDYNRDEIWAMFNKGKKRKYYEYNDYDDEDDDMEATGADVLEEELRSRLDAEREDRREMEEEKRRALEKQRRKMRR
ncbi:hypothetical protein I9W82_001407 [Candida metapsilosis]|uniref:Uncharacterized protein n=1 Tax=Candida metapsilosis TaxID=273372 RepID=A0A8H7ZLT6_9ASCO|nr:hypothetical protein I9W82_001407 [Candida metapsilosis]